MSDAVAPAPDRSVAIALSGGVDSAVAAALLLEEGLSVVTVTLRLGVPGDEDALAAARSIADRLDVAHHTIDVAELFRERVISPFVQGYLCGTTPNPCVACNEHVKFGALLAWCDAEDIPTLATGHYARILDEPGGPWLARGLDTSRDQSYFLYRVSPEALARTRFPLGALTKKEVRARALALGLADEARPESREICFARDGYPSLIREHAPNLCRPGEIVTLDGTVLGTHEGVYAFTVGQRKGLRLSGGPWFVASIDGAAARVVVARREELPVTRIACDHAVWRLPEEAAELSAQLRYNGIPVAVRARRSGSSLALESSAPVEPVAPGQSAVCYKGERVVAGGIVVSTC